ncbi:MAG TPA: PQQ-binding-like beta-propeller repeat protein [Acidimicrobiales bacterium]|nr:PQQ-binding-like beta-propeller repeat protein [Acidimicrobiales bacterium]
MTRRGRGRRVGLAAILGGIVAAGSAAGAPAAFAGTSWTTYHGDLARSGVDAGEKSLDPIRAVWTARLDGQAVFGQPVVVAGRVFAVTEGDDVYALDAHDGHVLWAHNIGVPLSNVAARAGCGNIDPLGITSTPAVDLARSTVFVVGEVSSGGTTPVHHQMVGFNIYTGARTVSVGADPALPAGEDALHLQQRAALAVANGRVYVAYGGLDGDCGNYHGWVVGVDEGGTRGSYQFDTTPTSNGGAVWNGGGGPSVDASGNVYVVTGNPNNGQYTAGSYADSVVKLSPTLQLLHSFHDPNTSAAADEDLGTSDALLLPNGEVFTAGKSNVGFLLRQSDLGPVHQIGGVCSSNPDGGATYDSATDSVYVPCSGGSMQQVRLSSATAGWNKGNVNGSPILVGSDLWAASYSGGLIEEHDPATGNVVQSVPNGPSVPHFATPSAADGLLLLGTDAGVEAFDGPSGPPAPAPPPAAPTAGYRLVASDGGVFSFGTAAYYGSLGGVRLAAPIVGAARTVDGKGYWLVASDGGVFSFGDARFYGSTGGVRLAQPIVGMAPAPDGRGYWLVARDGGVFSFGPDARFAGSTGGVRLNAPVVAMAADPVHPGYWLFGADGGVFSFGGAPFWGSTGGVRLARPVVAAAAAPDGRGYWMVAADGGVFDYGPSAGFHGSTGGVALDAPIVGLAADAKTGGYWLTASDGGVFTFGAPFEGSTGGVPLTRPVVAITGA